MAALRALLPHQPQLPPCSPCPVVPLSPFLFSSGKSPRCLAHQVPQAPACPGRISHDAWAGCLLPCHTAGAPPPSPSQRAVSQSAIHVPSGGPSVGVPRVDRTPFAPWKASSPFQRPFASVHSVLPVHSDRRWRPLLHPGPNLGEPRSVDKRAKRGAVATSATLSFSGPLIQATDTWGIWTVMLAAAAGGFWSEKFAWGRALSGPLVSTLLGLLASNTGLIPTDAPAYSVVNAFLLPLAVPLLLLGADLRRVVRDTGRLLLAFCIGAAGTVAGTVVAFLLVPLRGLGNDSWKIAAALMSRHIGGAVNYVAVAEAFGASPSVVAAGLAADNLLCAAYFSALFALAAGIPAESQEGRPQQPTNGENLPEAPGIKSFSTGAATAALALSAAICWGGVRVSRRLQFPGGTIPCAAALTVLLATLLPSHVAPLVPSAEVMASLLLQVFFACVGAAGSVAQVVQRAPSLFLFSFIQIFVHLAIILGVGRALSFELREVLLASNANVGGPTTGAGMASAKGWRSLTVPTILIGVFGYAVATFLSIYVGYTYLRFM